MCVEPKILEDVRPDVLLSKVLLSVCDDSVVLVSEETVSTVREAGEVDALVSFVELRVSETVLSDFISSEVEKSDV